MMLVIREGEWNRLLLFVSFRYKYCSNMEKVIRLISGSTILTKSAGK